MIRGHNILHSKPEYGVASPWECQRCGHREPGIEWPHPPPSKEELVERHTST